VKNSVDFRMALVRRVASLPRYLSICGFCFALFAVIASPRVAAQSSSAQAAPYALIFGTVYDAAGHTIYGVKVKIRRSYEKKSRWEVYSNHTGEFAQRVPTGKADYVVWADVKDFRSDSGKKLKPGAEVPVHVDGDEREDVGIHLDWQ
jgi:hypothetical protein